MGKSKQPRKHGEKKREENIISAISII